LGKTSKPAASDRFTIWSLHAPVRQTMSAIGSVQKFSHIQFRLSGARHWLKR
jgi:hypothetical protein